MESSHTQLTQSTVEYSWNKVRRKTESLQASQVISGVFKDVFFDISRKVTDYKSQKLKFKIIGTFACLGILGGHTYSAYRGFTRLKLYSRHLMVGGGLGTLCSFPIISFLNMKDKQFPKTYILIRGGLFGGICGLTHRGYNFIFPYSIIGIILHSFILLSYYEFIEPIYYYHILKWPDYIPPKWWPYQHITGLQVYLNELDLERLNVTYPEDLEYFSKLDKNSENIIKQKKEIEFERNFIHHSEITEGQQLDNNDLFIPNALLKNSDINPKKK